MLLPHFKILVPNAEAARNPEVLNLWTRKDHKFLTDTLRMRAVRV